MHPSTATRELKTSAGVLQPLEIEIATLSSNLESGAEYNTLPDADLLNNQLTG